MDYRNCTRNHYFDFPLRFDFDLCSPSVVARTRRLSRVRPGWNWKLLSFRISAHFLVDFSCLMKPSLRNLSSVVVKVRKRLPFSNSSFFTSMSSFSIRVESFSLDFDASAIGKFSSTMIALLASLPCPSTMIGSVDFSSSVGILSSPSFSDIFSAMV